MHLSRIMAFASAILCISCALSSAGPLHEAVVNGNLAGVQARLDRNADVNEQALP